MILKNSNSGKKNMAGAGLGMIAFTVTQIVLRQVKATDTNDMIIAGILIAVGIFFVVSFYFDKNNKLNKKSRIILCVLMMSFCIFMACDMIIMDIFTLQSDFINIVVIAMGIISIASLVAFIVYLRKEVKKLI